MGGGKSSGGGNVASSPYEDALARVAMANQGESAPLRAALRYQLQNMMGVKEIGPLNQFGYPSGGYEYGTPNYDASELPLFQPLFGLQKQSLESQYQQAKKNILSTSPQGGNLTGALSNLEMNRASNIGALPAQISSNITQDMINKAYGYAMGAPTTTISGLSSAAGTYGNRQAADMAQQASYQQSSYGLLGGIGHGVGKAVGGAMGK